MLRILTKRTDTMSQVSVDISTLNCNLELICIHREEIGEGEELITGIFRAGGNPLWGRGPGSRCFTDILHQFLPLWVEKKVHARGEGVDLLLAESCWWSGSQRGQASRDLSTRRPQPAGESLLSFWQQSQWSELNVWDQWKGFYVILGINPS